jgi:hypothetical protein
MLQKGNTGEIDAMGIFYGLSSILYEFVRTMCGSRTGGWSLPGVMSD